MVFDANMNQILSDAKEKKGIGQKRKYQGFKLYEETWERESEQDACIGC